MKIVNFFSALGDETRLKILKILIDKDKTVTEIHKSIRGLTLSAVSHQLKYLSDLDIVIYKKKGKEKIFHLNDKFCWCILNNAFKHFKNDKRNN